ncbi:hypothetical protein QYG89_09895 [Bacillus sp. B190/17]|uniref:Uncharacterized protein n=1 Tax=Bacillus lumedeiriae TaxID=3058829 RepID=A0ABW8I929_9BACI
MYFFTAVSDEIQPTRVAFHRLSRTKHLVLGAVFASLAALFQAAGGMLPIIGYLISPLATAPLLLCSMLSIGLGCIAYLLANLLLLILQPSELIVFPFTTGLLGLGIGASFYFFKKRLSIIISGASLLTAGIAILLYGFKFPVLGPSVSGTFSYPVFGCIFLFSFFYSWIWVEAGLLYLKRLKTIIAS